MTLTTTNLEGLRLVHRGKVRETYEVDDRHLLLVATDRLSAFDVVFEQAIPDKGALLTRLSTWWFGELADLGRSHFVSVGSVRHCRSLRVTRRWRRDRCSCAAPSASTPNASSAATSRARAGWSTSAADR